MWRRPAEVVLHSLLRLRGSPASFQLRFVSLIGLSFLDFHSLPSLPFLVEPLCNIRGLIGGRFSVSLDLPTGQDLRKRKQKKQRGTTHIDKKIIAAQRETMEKSLDRHMCWPPLTRTLYMISYILLEYTLFRSYRPTGRYICNSKVYNAIARGESRDGHNESQALKKVRYLLRQTRQTAHAG